MKKLNKRLLVAGVLSVMSASAFADVAFNIGLTSDYRFRGISQSGKSAAVSGGIDFSTAAGVYVGTWASTIDFDPLDGNVELDLYGGYKFKGAGIDWDVGAIYYGYPGSDGDDELPFVEGYIGGTVGPINIKYAYSPDYSGVTEEAASYLGITGTFDVGGGYSLAVSYGKSIGDGIEEAWGDEYADWKIGVSKEFGGFGFNLAYIGNDLDPEITDDVFNSESVVVLTVSKSF